MVISDFFSEYVRRKTQKDKEQIDWLCKKIDVLCKIMDLRVDKIVAETRKERKKCMDRLRYYDKLFEMGEIKK